MGTLGPEGEGEAGPRSEDENGGGIRVLADAATGRTRPRRRRRHGWRGRGGRTRNGTRMPSRPVHLIASNRLERLVDRLASRWEADPGDPLEGEVVVVQSRGMATWLEQRLADRNGVSFGCRFPFPRHLLNEVAAAVAPDAPADRAFEPEPMVWRILAELDAVVLEGGAPWEPVLGYLAGDPSGLRRFQLADRVARLFDDYLVYRPGWLLAWEDGLEAAPTGPALPTGPDAAWQAALWRRLCGGRKPWHAARLGSEILRRLREPGRRFPGLPRRLAVFGISTLAPFHLSLLDALACSAEVDFHRLEPCADYWGEIPTRRELAVGAGADDTLEAERGHRLLRAWGRPGREFQRRVLDFDWDPGEEPPFEEPAGETMLADLQRGLLRFPEPGETPSGTPEPPSASASIQVHVTHGPLRELQVLREHLLAWFSEGVEPREVLVLTPRIEEYAPLLPAVFGAESAGGPRIPWSVSDRSRRSASRIAGAFLRLLGLHGSRTESESVLTLLEEPAVMRRFGIDAERLGAVRAWIREAPVWWGLDADVRAAEGLGDDAVGTWRRAVDRLVLGHAMEASGGGSGAGPLVSGIVPMPAVSGDRAALAGALAEFVDALASRLRSWDAPRSVADWSVELHATLAAFFDCGPEQVDDLAVVREALGGLAAAGGGGTVAVAVVAEALRTRLETASTGGGFLSGGVTFCAFQPMRSVPARVLCVLGLSDDTFPRRRPVPEFDLMARHPEPGDASRGEDDRHLFLETVLSARERLYLSHPGLSVRDGTEAPPSVVVADLLDTLAERWGDGVVEGLVVRHRLHPWSADHFVGDPRRFTFSAGAARAARLLAGPRRLPPRFCAEPLGEPVADAGASAGSAEVSLEDLQAFAANPARWFVERRLGLRLPKEEEVLAACEPFALEGLARHGLRTELVEHFLGDPAGPAPDPAPWRETGRLPLGWAGQLAWEDELASMRRFAKTVAEARGAGPARERTVRIRVGTRLLVGRIQTDASGNPLRHRPARVRARDLLALWFDVLACRAAVPDGGADLPSSPLGRWVHLEKDEPKVLSLPAPEDPLRELAAWLDLMDEARTRAVPAPPESALAYAEAVAEAEDPSDPEPWRREAALRVARKAWDGGDRMRGEGADPCLALCFSRLGEDPFDREFERLAVERFLPPWRAAESARPKKAPRAPKAAKGGRGTAEGGVDA